MVMFADRPWEMRAPGIQRGRELHRKYHGTDAPPVMLTDFCVCGTDLAATADEARRYQGKFVESNFHHYEFLGDHFKTVTGGSEEHTSDLQSLMRISYVVFRFKKK